VAFLRRGDVPEKSWLATDDRAVVAAGDALAAEGRQLVLRRQSAAPESG